MKVPIRVSTQDTGGAYPGTLEMMLVEWKKKPGDRVQTGEEIVTLQTEKTEQSLVAQESGILREITVEAGCEFIVTNSRTEECGGKTFYQTVLGFLEVDEGAAVHPAVAEKDDHSARQGEGAQSTRLVRITPVAKKMLQDQGIAIDGADALRVIGTNSRGVIDRAEVERYVARMQEAKQDQGAAEGRGVEVAELVFERPSSEGKVESKTSSADPESLPMRTLEGKPIIGASPAARMLARREGVDLSLVQGTGPAGIILPKDVLFFKVQAEERDPDALQELPRATRETSEEVPTNLFGKEIRDMSRVQQAIARNLAVSWRKPTAQDSWIWSVSDLVHFHRDEKETLERIFGAKVSLMVPVLLGLARVLACEEFWRFNGAVQESANEERKIVFVKSMNVHLGIAFNTPDDNLVILTMRDANLQSTESFLRCLAALRAKARDKTYTVHDATGYSFIFNNVGGLDNLIPQYLRVNISHRFGYSLLSGDTSALLSMGSVGPTDDVSVQLSFDHQIINGGHALKFVVALYQEIFERVLPELNALCARQRAAARNAARDKVSELD